MVLPSCGSDHTIPLVLFCRSIIAFVWFYQGLVPKLLGPHRDELTMNLALGVSPETATRISQVAGVTEIVMAAALLVFWKKAWPLWATLASMVLLLAYTVVLTPQFTVSAFSSVSTNTAVAGLAVVALALQRKRTTL